YTTRSGSRYRQRGIEQSRRMPAIDAQSTSWRPVETLHAAACRQAPDIAVALQRGNAQIAAEHRTGIDPAGVAHTTRRGHGRVAEAHDVDAGHIDAARLPCLQRHGLLCPLPRP